MSRLFGESPPEEHTPVSPALRLLRLLRLPLLVYLTRQKHQSTMADGIQQIFYEIPPITRIWVCGSVLLTAACFLEFVNPFSLYLSMKLISKGQVWRLITPFLFFGDRFNIEFFFQMYASPAYTIVALP
jgi:hypothetical protein